MLCSNILLSLVNSVLMCNLSISEKIKIVQLWKFSVWVLNLKLFISYLVRKLCLETSLYWTKSYVTAWSYQCYLFVFVHWHRDKSGVLPSCTRVDGCHWQVFASHILCYHPKFRCTTLTSLLGRIQFIKNTSAATRVLIVWAPVV